MAEVHALINPEPKFILVSIQLVSLQSRESVEEFHSLGFIHNDLRFHSISFPTE